ncbi:MAG: hypothetical protein R3B84_24245 [Zavarzinella sp.]
MKQAEKQRLTALTRDAVAQLTTCPSKVKEHAEKVAARYSPTNAEQYRKLSEIVWWLIAVDCVEDALGLLDAICEVDDNYYWMFHALGSAFATRAWLRARYEQVAAAREDALTALHWIGRDPNSKAITESEVRGALERFDGWLERAAGERGTVTALHVLSHALRVLVMYQQFAVAGDSAAKAIPPGEFTARLESGVQTLHRRINSW